MEHHNKPTNKRESDELLDQLIAIRRKINESQAVIDRLTGAINTSQQCSDPNLDIDNVLLGEVLRRSLRNKEKNNGN